MAGHPKRNHSVCLALGIAKEVSGNMTPILKLRKLRLQRLSNFCDGSLVYLYYDCHY